MQAFRTTRQAQKFPPAKIGDTVKVCIPDIDCGRCNSQNEIGVEVDVDSSKGLYKTGITQGKLNLWYARNQLITCTEEIVNTAHVPSNEISPRECDGKSSLSSG